MSVVLLCLSVVVCTLALFLSGSAVFRPYFGNINPLVATIAITAVATASLIFLDSHDWLRFSKKGALRQGLLYSAIVATLLAIPIILVDVALVFPTDMNVPSPQSLLFYPVMGYVAETVFHLLPLSLLLIAVPLTVRHINRETLLQLCLVLVSFLEPAFQLAWTPSWERPAWADAYVWLHVWLFNALQLHAFKRYGFLSMYAFRLVYYLHWHIVWGYLRLQLLF